MSGKTKRNFQRMHLGSGDEPKRAHRTFLGARWHLHRHRQRHRIDTDLISVYPCWFTDDNERDGRKHYHIGHYATAPGRTVTIGRMRIKTGIEVRVRFTPEEFSQLTRMAGDMSPYAYASRVALGVVRTGTVCCCVDPAACTWQVAANRNRAR